MQIKDNFKTTISRLVVGRTTDYLWQNKRQFNPTDKDGQVMTLIFLVQLINVFNRAHAFFSNYYFNGPRQPVHYKY